VVESFAAVYPGSRRGRIDCSAWWRSTYVLFIVRRTSGMVCIGVALFGKYNLLNVLTLLILNTS
jgi:hypothetical protein